jgi:valyl-tRNA synthetase
MTEVTGEFAGMKVEPTRQAVVEKLTVMGLIEQVKEHRHNVGTCYRCHSVIEPLPLAQFFIKTKPLAEAALKALDTGGTVILGAGRDKILAHWLTNIRDWNISRQIVWGIRIPVWYEAAANPEMEVGFLNKERQFVRGKLGELLASGYELTEIEAGLQTLRPSVAAPFVIAKTKPDGRYLQETDTFDTWFSSGQWPVVTLATNKERDLDYYYPTSVMETAYEILPFWVMRMMMLGAYLTGMAPFKYVYLHGLVRDEKGQKMSKSKGNVINPLDLTAKYGTDAIRMALVMSTVPGQDSNTGEDKIRGMRNLANKIWNAARYVLENSRTQELKNSRQDKDDEFKAKLKDVVAEVTGQLEKLKIGLAAETVYNEFWHWYCDDAIEANKKGEIGTETLKEGLEVFLKLLHPFVPFVTEAVWNEVFPDKGLLAASSWPMMD